jgi:hypothetical protein
MPDTGLISIMRARSARYLAEQNRNGLALVGDGNRAVAREEFEGGIGAQGGVNCGVEVREE